MISVGTPMDVPANQISTSDRNHVQTIVHLSHFQCWYLTKLECHTLYKSHRDLKQIPGRWPISTVCVMGTPRSASQIRRPRRSWFDPVLSSRRNWHPPDSATLQDGLVSCFSALTSPDMASTPNPVLEPLLTADSRRLVSPARPPQSPHP